MSLSHTLKRARSSFLYLPSIYGLFAMLLALISIQIDDYVMNHPSIYNKIPTALLSDINLATTILSSISGSLLTMTTITFSTILVVLTTYLSQFSPRTLQDFITDNKTQHVLGVFVGGFVYSILLLLFLGTGDTTVAFITPSLAVLFAIICLVVFVFFIHHVSSWIQVSNLIHNITLTTIKKIENSLTDREATHKDAPWEDWESEEIQHIEPVRLRAEKIGYIQDIDIEGLVNQASKDNCIVRIEKKLGDYVDKDTPIMSLWTLDHHKVNSDYKTFISVGTKKAVIDAIEFGLIKIVEIALRALSSAVNDPNTAINCIDNLGKILSKLGKKHLPRAFHNDQGRNLRVILSKPGFSDYLYRCFYQIRQNGLHDISVLSAVIRALTLVAESNAQDIKETVWEFTQYIREGIDHELLLSLDRKHINQLLESLAKAAGHSQDFKPV